MSALITSNVFVAGEAGYHTIRIPTLVATPQGTLVAFAEGRRSSSHDAGDIDLITRRSTDGGQTWSPISVVWQEPGEITMGNPAPVVDQRTGDIVLLFTRNNMWAFRTRSTDDGLTFADPDEITHVFEPLRECLPWLRIATGPVHGIQLPTGRLIVTFWMNDKPIAQVREAHFGCGTLYSDDAGHTWHASQPVPDQITGMNECTVYPTSRGTLRLNIRSQWRGWRVGSESADDGQSWQSPHVERDLPCPTCQASSLRLADGTVLFSNIPHGGEAGARGPRKDLTVRRSCDDGDTWQTACRITDTPAGYSDLTQLPNGKIYVLYENGENSSTERVSLTQLDPDSWA